MGDYGLSSMFGSSATLAEGAGAAAETGAAASEFAGAGEAMAGAGAFGAGAEGWGARVESHSGVGAGIDPFATEVFGAGIAGDAGAGVGAGLGSEVAAGEPGFFEQMGTLYNSASPYLNTASKIMQAGNMLKSSLSGSGAPGT